MESHKSYREETNENKGSICPLRTLVTILKKCHSEQPPVLLEEQFLQEFSLTEVIPLTLIQPRTFIEYMMKIHTECTTIISKDPTYLRELVYKYNSGEKEEEYVFSNNMPFYIDVVTMCFMHIVRITKVIYAQPAVNDLIAIMRRKYHTSHTDTSDTPLLITESKIAMFFSHSFSSVTIYLLYCFNNNFASPITKILRKWNLTNIFCAPLALIVPVIKSEYKTEYKIPLPLLLAMAVALDSDNKPTYVLYQRILTLYTSEVFSRKFKLAICINCGIIYKKENEYRFAPYFTKLRKKAIKLISSIKVNDASMKYTLSLI